jgi:mRNA interferase HigB
VHVISKKALRDFWARHPAAKTRLEAWHRMLGASRFESFSDIKRAFNSADYVPPFIVFDVGGNNYRVVCVAHFNVQRLYVRHVFTHAQYDRWSQLNRSSPS